MPNQRDGIMRFRLFKKTPTVHLIKRKGGPPSPKTLPANERKALFWHKWLGSSLVTFAIFGHAAFISVAYLLVMFWPPYQQAFIVTNWIADILPHSIFGVLAVTQEQLNNVGATLPRAAYIHFIVPQLIMAIIYLLWTLLNCRQYWRLYPDYEAYLRRVYVNLDERKAWFRERKRILSLIAMVAFLALSICPALSPDFLLTVIEYGKTPGLMSYYATSMSLVGVGPVFVLMTYIFIVNCRRIFEAFWIDSKRLKD